EDLIAHSQGKPDLLKDPEVANVVTHRHPLPYSQIHPEFWTLLNQVGTLIQEFRPGPLEDLEEGVFDRHDGFYYPIAGFGELERGGPHIQVWRIENRDGFVMSNPGDPRGLLSDVLWWTGNGDLAKNDFAQAEAYYRRSLKLNPDSAELRVFLGATLLFQNRFEEALVEMREGIENGVEMGKIERAIFFKRSFRGDLYARLGDVFTALEFFTEATMIYERAISMGYDTGEIYSKLGLVYALIGKFDAAKVQFQNALERMDGAQDLIQMRMILGVALLSQGRVHEAIEEIRQVLDYGVAPKDIEESVFLIKSSRGDLFAGLGTVFASLDRLSDAVRNYERALAMAYKNVDLHNNLGVVYYRLEALDEAAAQFREALAMDADNTDARYNLEQVKRKQGRKVGTQDKQ
ncbi:MAG: tetratricopeptide repeat protein, partial [bacterium]|nr:tetratricopeptide repeat protein [bacterium]